MTKNQNKVLFAILDWGLGHASRSMPLINDLLKSDNEVVIASSGKALELLKLEYPKADFYELPAYDVKYSKNMSLSIASQLPKLISVIRKEKNAIDLIIKERGINRIISDNRYGCYNKNIESVFLGHQLNLKIPGLISKFSPFINSLHKNHIKKFDKIWIPDFDNHLLSGELSVSEFENIEFIGPLSRFKNFKNNESNKKYKYTAILSGPEPLRTEFEEILTEKLKNKEKSALIRGVKSDYKKKGNIEIFGMLNKIALEELISQSETLIIRSGYSSIMDLYYLKKPAIIIPTPGQTEQEYLAKYHSRRDGIKSMLQNEIELE